MKDLKIVYTKVVADLFHYGHVNFFRQAKKLGDKLYVHVVDDERIRKHKCQPIMTQQERIAVVEACWYVDKVFAEGPKVITKDFMRERGYAVYAFSYVDEEELKTKRNDCLDLPESMLGVIPYTPNISTTAVIQRILDHHSSRDRIEGKGYRN
ncbi:MAG: adenylyltransferase/cytidyltransferase family protein [Candidatus Loosdrechtia sp.]|uniref:adenylyltransferase/cytidyltransferase family protein n=1 Tax=Candidatus Loosdrechtia sp. TaxID=3101272 RepID=UPI003A6E3C63|nr:MAG: adenylyltransferase/cytidyltransferase family protein [Candidatus Jettenia sp. AMX2]